MKSRLLIIVLMLGALSPSAFAQLLAEVRTSAGNFSIDLHYTTARRTVSHFMRLASGVQPWMDATTGKLQYGTPFYNGLQFFIPYEESPLKSYIQTGSRNNAEYTALGEYAGTGYVLRDEIRYFNNNLNTPAAPHYAYTVSMATRAPHSSSSQFLITRVADSTMNGKNSAFGIVNQLFYNYDENGALVPSYPGYPNPSSGRAVVDAIHASQTPVTISSITFRRIGAVAQSFDENEYIGEAPLMGPWPVTSIKHTESDVHLHYDPLQGAQLRMYYSLDLWNWYSFPAANQYLPSGSPSNPPNISGHGNFEQVFYRLSALVYPVTTSLGARSDLWGKTITVGQGTPHFIQFIFDQNGLNPVYRLANGFVGALEFEYSSKGPYHGDLLVTSPGLGNKTYRLYFGGTDLETPPVLSVYSLMSVQILEEGEDTIESHFTMTP